MAYCRFTNDEVTLKITGPDTFKSLFPYHGMVELTAPGGGPPRSMLDSNGELLQRYRNNDLILRLEMIYIREETKSDGTKETISGSKTEELHVPYEKTGHMKFTINFADKFERISIMPDGHFTSTKTIEEFNSRDKQSLMVSLPNLQGKVKGDSVNIAVRSTVPIAELFVVVISKDVIVSTFHETFAETRTYAFSYPIDKARIAPSARVVVFTFSKNGEIIPDSTQFEVDGLFTNRVSVAFDKMTAKPGNAIALNVQASSNSFVGILAVDKSVQILGDGNDITTDEVMEEVEKLDSKAGGPFCSWHCLFCCSRKRRSIEWLSF